MQYESIYTTQITHDMGQKAQEEFKKIAEDKDYSVTVSTNQEDIFQHIDLKLGFKNYFQNISYTVDVKSIKSKDKISQYDQSVIELINVQGKQGWIYGKADFIAFQTTTGFLLVEREKIIEYYEKNKDNLLIEHHRPKYHSPFASINSDFKIKYIDAIFWMTFDELKQLPHEEWI